MDASTASLSGRNGGEEVRPYKIRVSSKYLDLTRKKLELTRLPHEILLPPAREWENGTPKSEIEPLIDYWLETYTWRTRETHLNTTLPQFRTAIQSSSSAHPLRIHFLHIRSAHPNAIPLILIPSFPLTNLSLRPSLWKPLLEPNGGGQAFHIVVPSIPGLGFSDAFMLNGKMLQETAEIFDTLMKRLGYGFYLASSTGSGVDSPAHIDYHLARLMGDKFPDSCLGVHVLGPPLQKPSLATSPLQYLKFGFARFFHAPLFGYAAEDFAALRESVKAAKKDKGILRSQEHTPVPARAKGSVYGVVGMVGLREPNTLSYALCDSPVGLLSLVSSVLKRRNPAHQLEKEDLIDVTQLAWLPGPEAAMRFWAGAVSEVEEMQVAKARGKRSKVAVTVFGADGVGEEEYACPAWGEGRHEVVFSQRVNGRAGLVAWEREDVIIAGVRGLASAVAKVDQRLRLGELEEVVVGDNAEDAILEEVEVQAEGDLEVGDEHGNEHGMQLDVESPDTVVAVELS